MTTDNWERGARKFLQQFIPLCNRNEKCVGCEADMDAVMEYISTIVLRTEQRVRAEERERVLRLIDRMRRMVRTDKAKAHSGYYIRALTDLRNLTDTKSEGV